jgi:hypothetical protein
MTPELQAALKEVLKLHPRIADLIRQQRAELHEADLITDDEYADLCGIAGAVDRLETYDDLRSKLQAALERAERAEEALAHFACFVCNDANTPLYCLNCAQKGWVSREEHEQVKAELARLQALPIA